MFLRSTRTTGSEKRYNTNRISIESSRLHLLMLFFEVSRTSVFRLEHFIAAVNRAFEHFLADGMCRGDVCSKLRKHLLQIGHFCGSFTMNSGASLLPCEHKSFHSALSCAVCAQILIPSFGKPVSTDRACETRFLRRPVLFCPAFYKAEEGLAS